jgi:chromosome segregation ATPase
MSILNIQSMQDQVREPSVMNSVAGWFIGMEDYGMVTKAISYAAWFFVEVALCVPVITIPLYTRLVEEYTIRRNDAALQQHLNSHPELLPNTGDIQLQLQEANRLKTAAEESVSQKDVQIGEFTSQLETARNSVGQKDIQIAQLGEQIRTLTQQKNQESEHLRLAQETIGELNPRLETAANKIGELERDNQSKTEENALYLQQLTAYDQQVDQLQRTIRELTEQKNQLSGETIPQLQEQLNQAQEARTQAETELEQANERAETAAEQAQEALQQERQKYGLLEQTTQRLEQQIQNFPRGEVVEKARLDESERKHAEAMREKEQSAIQVGELQGQLSEFEKNRVTPLEAQIEQLRQEVLGFNEMKQKFDSAVGMLEVLKAGQGGVRGNFYSSGEINGITLESLKGKTA